MWDYDKLFADGNVIGIKNCYRDKVFNNVVDVTTSVIWLEGYKNEELSCEDQYVDVDDKIKHGYTTDFEIQYIIRLDEHGNVVEKLFDRERDMKSETKPMPELETGMFVRVENEGLGYVDIRNNRIVYQLEGYDDINGESEIISDIIEVYGKESCSFNGCMVDKPIWRSPDYQAYLDSKES